MLKLYEARNLLINRRLKGLLLESQYALDPILNHLVAPLITLQETLDAKSAFTIVTESELIQSILVMNNTNWTGIVRRDSLDIINRTGRFEALQLPLTSVMVRSFVLLSDTLSVGEVAEELIEKRALGAVLTDDDGAATKVVTIDWLEDLFVSEERREKSATESVRQGARAQAV